MICPKTNSATHCIAELFPIYQNKHWTIKWQDDRSIEPLSHCIILKIVGFVVNLLMMVNPTAEAAQSPLLVFVSETREIRRFWTMPFLGSIWYHSEPLGPHFLCWILRVVPFNSNWSNVLTCRSWFLALWGFWDLGAKHKLWWLNSMDLFEMYNFSLAQNLTNLETTMCFCWKSHENYSDFLKSFFLDLQKWVTPQKYFRKIVIQFNTENEDLSNTRNHNPRIRNMALWDELKIELVCQSVCLL